jgi:hypothetical protein
LVRAPNFWSEHEYQTSAVQNLVRWLKEEHPGVKPSTTNYLNNVHSLLSSLCENVLGFLRFFSHEALVVGVEGAVWWMVILLQKLLNYGGRKIRAPLGTCPQKLSSGGKNKFSLKKEKKK